MQLLRFSDGDDVAVAVTMVPLDAAGRARPGGTTTRSTWIELQSHAAFPAVATIRERDECTVPAGNYRCWRYTVAFCL